MVGNANYENKALYILSSNIVHDRSFGDVLSVIKHEIIYIAFDQLQNADEANILIAEEIAVACSEQIYTMALKKAIQSLLSQVKA